MKPVTAIVIGAGDRGERAYAPYALHNQSEFVIVGVAEPIQERRERFAKTYGLTTEQQYDTWQTILEKERLADVAIICTMDRMHREPTLKALELGYHVLLEKPMSPDPQECVEMELAAKEHQRLLTICHVLRYTTFWQAIKQEIQDGAIGEVVSIQLNENVGNMHMSHSFVRGNWRNSVESSPMILQKSCHDMDILAYLMDEPCERISSFGSLMHFTEANKPEGAPVYCIQGCPAEESCQYHAVNYYLSEAGRGWAKKFVDQGTDEEILAALSDGPYGRCVYQTDNNVVDHQVVNMEFKSGATAMFSMSGFTHDNTRIVQIMGTKGDIRGDMMDYSFTVNDFVTKKAREMKLKETASGHGGGDFGIVASFLDAVRSFDEGGTENLSSASISVRSHLMAFAAEHSRQHGGAPVEIQAYYDQFAAQPQR